MFCIYSLKNGKDVSQLPEGVTAPNWRKETVMPKNVGGAERAIRLMIGAVLLVLAFLHVVTGTWAIVAYVVGAVAIVTGLVRYCPAWSIFGINTCQTAHK